MQNRELLDINFESDGEDVVIAGDDRRTSERICYEQV